MMSCLMQFRQTYLHCAWYHFWLLCVARWHSLLRVDKCCSCPSGPTKIYKQHPPPRVADWPRRLRHLPNYSWRQFDDIDLIPDLRLHQFPSFDYHIITDATNILDDWINAHSMMDDGGSVGGATENLHIAWYIYIYWLLCLVRYWYSPLK